jgi:hypothetical protein
VIFRGRADMAASTAGIPNTCNPRGIAWAGFGHHCSVKPPGDIEGSPPFATGSRLGRKRA